MLVFDILLKNYYSDERGEVFLELEIIHSEKNMFHCTSVVSINPCFEDGLMIKDADYSGLDKFNVIANSLFTPEQLEELGADPFEEYWPEEDLKEPFDILRDELERFMREISSRITYKVHLTD